MNEDTYNYDEDKEEKEYEIVKDEISQIASNMNNTSADPADLRDIFLTAEREYVYSLLGDEKLRSTISELNEHSSDALFDEAKWIIDGVENGLFSDEEMESVEARLIVILAAIRDLVLVKTRTLRR